MEISPDAIVFFSWGPVVINGTIVFTWIVMLVIIFITWLATRRLTEGTEIPRWQNLVETIVDYMRTQIREIIHEEPDQYLPFLGTLFLFISIANLLIIVPGYQPPTGSIYTTSALALCVFFAVPIFGIVRKGTGTYLRHYIQPSVFMLPFTIIGEFSRTLALSIRLFGNIMSGTIIVGILVSIAPLFVPIVMQALGLLIGQIQAFIFAVLAAVYIASGTRAHHRKAEQAEESESQQEEETSGKEEEKNGKH